MYDVLIVCPGATLDLASWLALRGRHPSLRPIEKFVERSPFTGDESVLTTPHSAEAVVEGKSFGQFFWDGGRLLTPLEFPENAQRLRDLAADLAATLGTTVSLVDYYDLEFRTLGKSHQ